MKPTLFCLAIVTGLLAADPLFVQIPNSGPVSKPEPLNAAQMAVQTTIVSRLQPSYPKFSRAMPMPAIPSYQVVERVGNEDRLPFTVSIRWPQLSVSGYVRISDNAIFIFRPETKDYIPSMLDPRFGPAKEVRIEPVKST